MEDKHANATQPDDEFTHPFTWLWEVYAARQRVGYLSCVRLTQGLPGTTVPSLPVRYEGNHNTDSVTSATSLRPSNTDGEIR